MRYSVYFSQDEHGVTNYLVTVEVLVGEPNAQGGVSQEPEGPNRDGPGPQDPPNGQQGFLVPVPEAVNGANGVSHEGGSDGGLHCIEREREREKSCAGNTNFCNVNRIYMFNGF